MMKKLLLILLIIPFIGITQSKQKVTPVNKEGPSEIAVKFDVYLDSTKVESDSILVGLSSLVTNPKLLRISDTFTTYLMPQKVYNVVIGHPKYGKQTMKVEVRSNIQDTKINIYLEKGAADKYIGYLKYNKFYKNYLVYNK